MTWDTRLEKFHHFFRQNRMKWFEQNFDIREDTRILDVGGGVRYWSYIKSKPNITILNIFETKENLPPNITWIVGDGRKMEFEDNEFDVVFSNSVIEHLQEGQDQYDLAKEIMRIGKSFFVQTPYRYAVIDSHYITFLVHWLPRNIQKKILRYTSVWGLVCKPPQERVNNMVNTTNLLNLSEIKRCFPGARIRKERLLLLTKALIAYKLPATD